MPQRVLFCSSMLCVPLLLATTLFLTTEAVQVGNVSTLVDSSTAPSKANPQQRADRSSNIAIIGAGIGGAFTAYHLRELLNQSVNIQV